MDELDRHCRSRTSPRGIVTDQLQALVGMIYNQPMLPIDEWTRRRQARLLEELVKRPTDSTGLGEHQRNAMLELARDLRPR